MCQDISFVLGTQSLKIKTVFYSFIKKKTK